MKSAVRRFLPLLLVFASWAQANPTPFTDDFSGTSLDLSRWTTLLPRSGSSVVQSGGSVTTTGRGILATAQEWSGAYFVSGVFTLLNDFEHFNIALRTDLSATSHDERVGLIVTFVNDGNAISIQELTNPIDNWQQRATTGENGFNLFTGQAYAFSVLDTGSHVSVAVNGNTVLSADTTFGAGDRIAFYSREFPSTATRIDSLTITSVPDFGATVVLLGLASLPLFALRRGKLGSRNRKSPVHLKLVSRGTCHSESETTCVRNRVHQVEKSDSGR